MKKRRIVQGSGGAGLTEGDNVAATDDMRSPGSGRFEEDAMRRGVKDRVPHPASVTRDTAPHLADGSRAGRQAMHDDDYYAHVDIFDYDETIVGHPYMDQIKAAIVARVALEGVRVGRPISVLDVGTGSGQLARALCGVEGVAITLTDRDERSRDYCAAHPELNGLPFVLSDLAGEGIEEFEGARFDIVCALGVLHHVPPTNRTTFLRNLASLANCVLVADEGILEYETEQERRANARIWYGFVIGESRRRGLGKLAQLEGEFMASDTSPVRTPTADFKESPTAVVKLANEAGLRLIDLRRIGPWTTYRGGMYLADLEANSVHDA